MDKVKLLVPADVMQDVLNYLSNRPYKEVQGLINKIVQSSVEAKTASGETAQPGSSAPVEGQPNA